MPDKYPTQVRQKGIKLGYKGAELKAFVNKHVTKDTKTLSRHRKIKSKRGRSTQELLARQHAIASVMKGG